jgi:O-antigen/teichoic acid export membrane protein
MDIARSSTKIFLNKAGSSVLGFVGLAYFAQQLGPSQLGIFFLFQALVGILSFVADFGIRTAVEKRISEGSEAENALASGTIMKLSMLGMLAVILVSLRGPINEYIGATVTVLLVITIGFSDLGGLVLGVLRGELRVGATAVLDFSSTLLWVGFGALFIQAGWGAYSLIYGFLIGQAVRFVWGLYRCSTTFGRFSYEHARSLFDFAKYDFVGGLGWYAYNWLDVLVIGWFLTQSAVGQYEVAWRIAVVTLLFSNAIRQTVLPQISTWNTEGAISQIEGLLSNLITPALFFVIPSVLGVSLLEREMLGLFFGPEYTDAWLVLIVLTTSQLFRAIDGILSRVLLGMDRPDFLAYVTIVALSSNAVLNVLLVQQFGIVGAAVATGSGSVISLLLYIFLLSRTLSLSIYFPYGEVGWCVLAAVVMAAAIRSVQELLTVDTIPELLSVIAFGAVVYGGVVLVYGQLRQRIVTNARSLLT